MQGSLANRASPSAPEAPCSVPSTLDPARIFPIQHRCYPAALVDEDVPASQVRVGEHNLMAIHECMLYILTQQVRNGLNHIRYATHLT